MNSVGTSIIDIFKLRPSTQKVVICPHWQTMSDGSPLVAGNTLDAVYEHINKIWIPVPSGSTGATIKNDGSFRSKFFLSPNGSSDQYFHSTFEPISSTFFQAFYVIKLVNQSSTFFQTKNASLFNSSGNYQRVIYNYNYTTGNASQFYFNPTNNSNWYNGFVSILIQGFVGDEFGIINSISNSLSKFGSSISGINDSGFNLFGPGYFQSNYWEGDFAFLAIWEDSTPFTDKEIAQLMNFGKVYFSAFKNYG